MSMQVDLSKPLTDEERRYLADRGMYAELARADAMHGTTSDLGDGDGTGPRVNPLTTSEQAAVERERLLARLKELDGIEGVTAEEAPADDEVDPYEAWNVPELDKELERRGLPATGKKDAKVAALYDDDAKSDG